LWFWLVLIMLVLGNVLLLMSWNCGEKYCMLKVVGLVFSLGLIFDSISMVLLLYVVEG